MFSIVRLISFRRHSRPCPLEDLQIVGTKQDNTSTFLAHSLVDQFVIMRHHGGQASLGYYRSLGDSTQQQIDCDRHRNQAKPARNVGLSARRLIVTGEMAERSKALC